MNTTRRNLLKAGGAIAGAAVLSREAGAQSFPFTPNQRYPDPAVQILDPSFLKYRLYSSTLEQVATGMRWAEGPVYFPDGGYLLCSDIPNNRIMRFNENDGSFMVFRSPSNYANGNTRDRQGRLVTCEHSVTRRITRTEKDGSIIALADNYQGKRLNAPNDIIVKSDDTIWFSDPLFGINGEWEGKRAKSEQESTNVFRIGRDGKLTAVITDLVNPNGLAFSPDETKLYVVEWNAQPQHLELRCGRERRDFQQDQADRRGRPGRAGRVQGRPRRQSLVWLGQQRPAAGPAARRRRSQGISIERKVRGP
jgi:gluconolactonase